MFMCFFSDAATGKKKKKKDKGLPVSSKIITPFE